MASHGIKYIIYNFLNRSSFSFSISANRVERITKLIRALFFFCESALTHLVETVWPDCLPNASNTGLNSDHFCCTCELFELQSKNEVWEKKVDTLQSISSKKKIVILVNYDVEVRTGYQNRWWSFNTLELVWSESTWVSFLIDVIVRFNDRYINYETSLIFCGDILCTFLCRRGKR